MISLYNADKKELIGIFNSPKNAGKYLFGKQSDATINSSRIRTTIKRKGCITKNILGCRVAVRNSNEEHKKLLGDNIYWLNDGYYKPDNFLFLSYHSTREELYLKHLKS